MKLNYHCHFLIFIFIFIFILIPAATCFPQELDITAYLKKIEAGEKNEVVEKLPELKRLNSNNPSVIYLEGLLTEDGEKAFQIYNSLVEKYPRSKYADAAIYRIYSYFSAIDKMDKADFYLNRLKTEHPESPYIKLTEKITFTEKSKEIVKEEDKSKQKSETVTKVKQYKFTIQAGAFSTKANALKLKTDFDKAGYTSQVIAKTVGGSLFHVVNVGRFATEDEAKSFLNVINSKFKLHGWVVKLD